MDEPAADEPGVDEPGERCALCARTDVDEHWLWFEIDRMSPDEDSEYDEIELVFCSRQHAAAYLSERELTWPVHDHQQRTAGTRVDTYFLGCGLLAIILSVIGLVAVIRWIV